MSQTLSQFLGQQMRMEQRLTPQLIQSMNILQLPVTALDALIAEQLEKNIALEVVEPAPAEPVEVLPERAATQQATEDSASFGRLNELSRTYGLDEDERPAVRRRADGERDAKLDALANTPGSERSLQDELLDQWAMHEHPASLHRAGQWIIENLEEDGYLRIPLPELAVQAPTPVDEKTLETALSEVQSLEPPGIAARDLRECLLLQIDRMPGDNQIELTLVTNHLEDLAKNRLPAVAKATGYSVEEIAAAIHALKQSVYLRPGTLIRSRSEPPIHPDLIIDYAPTGGGLTVRLARGNSPELTISPEYERMSRNGQADKAVRKYVRENIGAAEALIGALRFRRDRLLDVGRIIAERQRDFFYYGLQALKVLRMNDVAAELGYDPSTISRTVADKYLQCPRGIFPLRSFFTSGKEQEHGEVTSWDSVRARVEEIIREEDAKHPLNDDHIVEKLEKEGIKLSRRTVAKYRQQLNIPPARQRKAY